VFEKTLSSSFAENGEFKRASCVALPDNVKFKDMGGMTDDAPTPPSTALALDLVASLCESKKSKAP
ncbi:MAG: hypothetical protein AAB250_18565, partial [Bdellovibrionota bacterium]